MIAIIGAGVMGETFVSGLIRSGVPAASIVISEKLPDRAEQVSREYGVSAREPQETVESAETILLAVKPQDARATLEAIGPHIEAGAALVSLAAGITTDDLQSFVNEGVSCIRAMPNTPAVIGEGMTVISAGSRCSDDALPRVRDLLAVVGKVVEVNETLQDAVTSISGSGPAYVFAIIEAWEAAAIERGLSPDVARELVMQTLFGAVQLARTSGTEPAELRRRVTSPGGTTQAALAVLLDPDDPQAGLMGLFDRATTAARDRSIELGRDS